MIAILAMLEDPTTIPAWLDRHLLTDQLPKLVEQLRVIHRPGPKPKLEQVLGRHRAALLRGGFPAIPRRVLQGLLKNPDLLLEARELIFFEGSQFWFAEPLTKAEQQHAARIAATAFNATQRHATPKSGFRWRGYVGVSLATAAVLLVVYLVRPFSKEVETADKPVGWGFAKIQQLDRKASPKETYTRLAEFANEWHKKPTPDAEGLAVRLTEFRQGCAALQLAKELPLSEAERRWLRNRCGDWSAEMDRHLRTLEETGDTEAFNWRLPKR